MDRRFRFKDPERFTLASYGLIALGILVANSMFSGHFKFDPLFTAAFVATVGWIGYWLMVWLNEGVRLRNGKVERLNFAGRVANTVDYKDVESFRQDGFSKRTRYYAIISGQVKIRMPESMEGFADFAEELRAARFGKEDDLQYPQFRDHFNIIPLRASDEIVEW